MAIYIHIYTHKQVYMVNENLPLAAHTPMCYTHLAVFPFSVIHRSSAQTMQPSVLIYFHPTHHQYSDSLSIQNLTRSRDWQRGWVPSYEVYKVEWWPGCFPVPAHADCLTSLEWVQLISALNIAPRLHSVRHQLCFTSDKGYISTFKHNHHGEWNCLLTSTESSTAITCTLCTFYMPVPPLGAGGIMLSGCPSVIASMRVCRHPCENVCPKSYWHDIFRILWMDFCQIWWKGKH